MRKNKKKAKRRLRIKLNLPRHRDEKIRTQGVRIFRGGVTVSKWRLVEQRPKIRNYNDTISIRGNIAVNKGAERQSEIMIEISSEALLEIVENHFELKGNGVGDLIRSPRKARRAASALIDVIDDIQFGLFGLINVKLGDIPLEPEIFDDPRSLEQLKEAQEHDREE